jgi:hypothetical protein
MRAAAGGQFLSFEELECLLYSGRSWHRVY